MKASDWKQKGAAVNAEEVVTVQLPSGMVIDARRPGPMQLALWGVTPFSLAGAASGGTATAGEPDLKQIMETMTGLRDLLLYCCVSPRLSLDPKGEDELHPRHVPDGDLRFIIRWATRGEEAAQLESFRGGRRDVGSAGGGEDVPSAAVEPAGDRGSGAGA